MCAFLPPAASGYSDRKMVEKVAQNSKGEWWTTPRAFPVAKYRMTFDKMTSHRPDRPPQTSPIAWWRVPEQCCLKSCSVMLRIFSSLFILGSRRATKLEEAFIFRRASSESWCQARAANFLWHSTFQTSWATLEFFLHLLDYTYLLRNQLLPFGYG